MVAEATMRLDIRELRRNRCLALGQHGAICWSRRDGSRIGILKMHGDQIRLVSLRGGPTRTISTKGYSDLLELYWGIDSQSMFVSTLEPGGAALLHVDLGGEAQPVWRQHQPTVTWGIPSPDGRHLAVLGSRSEANAWLIDNF